jgi:hypothetical protein
VYNNQAADRLFTRLRARYGVEPSVILRDQLAGFDAVPIIGASPVVALLTTGRGEPLSRKHLSRIFEKVGVESRVPARQLARLTSATRVQKVESFAFGGIARHFLLIHSAFAHL